MNQECPAARLVQKSLISNSFALRLLYPLLTIKNQRFQQCIMSINPVRGKGPPGDDHSPGRRGNCF